MSSFIFTECYNCAPITRVALESFYAGSDKHKVHIFGTAQDFEQLGPMAQHPNTVLIDYTNDGQLRQLYKQGHEGTAYIFAKVLSGEVGGEYDKIIHFDSDLVFKQKPGAIQQMDMILDNYEIAGSRRCYKNNPAGIPVDPNLPDTISTYFFGIRRSCIPKYDFDYLRMMCAGSRNPLGHDVFDFFDPVTFVAIRNGARIQFIDSGLIGGQNELGSKESGYKSNMHLDMGYYVAHFGGVGSGYAYFNQLSSPSASYANWAVGRYALFAELFLGRDIGYREPTVYGPDGRWVNGSYDAEILQTVREELLK